MKCLTATTADINSLNAIYKNCRPYYGEMHDHAATGGRSDGKCTLDEWKQGMADLEMDFATIVDHKQVRHMCLDAWDDTMFIGGTEAATWITDRPHLPIYKDEKLINGIHYNMVFASPEPLLKMLQSRPEFNFEGDALYGCFPRYPRYTVAGFQELIADVKRWGGFVSHVHPKAPGVLQSDDPLDYWFADETGLEVIYTYKADRNSQIVSANYKLWTDLLSLGKRVWATAGNDEHRAPSDKALSTIYAHRRHAQAFLDQMKIGNFTAGPVGIRMCIGDTPMGGKTEFDGKRVIISVGDFHKSVKLRDHQYRLDVISSDSLVCSKEICCDEETYLAFNAENVRFYRVEVIDITADSRIAIGNPVWNL